MRRRWVVFPRCRRFNLGARNLVSSYPLGRYRPSCCAAVGFRLRRHEEYKQRRRQRPCRTDPNRGSRFASRASSAALPASRAMHAPGTGRRIAVVARRRHRTAQRNEPPGYRQQRQRRRSSPSRGLSRCRRCADGGLTRSGVRSRNHSLSVATGRKATSMIRLCIVLRLPYPPQ